MPLMPIQLGAAVVIRYSFNGLIATSIHYLILYSCMEALHFRSVGVANLLASAFGILASFLGNKYYVFRHKQGRAGWQLLKFALLFSAIATLHGLFLHVWSDIYRLNYKAGFLLAVAIQFALGLLGSRTLIFTSK